MTVPIISYITFNKMGSTVRSLNSILRVDEDFDLYIVDNDSRDQTWEYIKSLNDPRIKRKKRFERNFGVVNAINWVLTNRKPDQDFINIENDVYNCNLKFVETFQIVVREFDAGLVHACMPNHKPDMRNHLTVSSNGYGLYEWAPLGAFFIVPANVMNSLGYYCEASYMADLELRRRVVSLGKKTGYTPHVQCINIDTGSRMGTSGFCCQECHLYQKTCKRDDLFCTKFYIGTYTGQESLHLSFHHGPDGRKKIRDNVAQKRLKGDLPLKCGTHHLGTLDPWEEVMRTENVEFFAAKYEGRLLEIKDKNAE